MEKKWLTGTNTAMYTTSVMTVTDIVINYHVETCWNICIQSRFCTYAKINRGWFGQCHELRLFVSTLSSFNKTLKFVFKSINYGLIRLTSTYLNVEPITIKNELLMKIPIVRAISTTVVVRNYIIIIMIIILR